MTRRRASLDEPSSRGGPSKFRPFFPRDLPFVSFLICVYLVYLGSLWNLPESRLCIRNGAPDSSSDQPVARLKWRSVATSPPVKTGPLLPTKRESFFFFGKFRSEGGASRHKLEHLEEKGGSRQSRTDVDGRKGGVGEGRKGNRDAGTAPLRLICIMFLLPASLRMSRGDGDTLLSFHPGCTRPPPNRCRLSAGSPLSNLPRRRYLRIVNSPGDKAGTLDGSASLPASHQ